MKKKGSISTKTLRALMAEARADPRQEEKFFQGLLDATIYAHTPAAPGPANRMQFVQFQRPDNKQYVLPVFSDRGKAEFAARSSVAIIAMAGRRLLELTRGATLMIDPNDDQVTLYPAEVSALLAGQPLALAATRDEITADAPVRATKPSEPPTDLVARLTDYFERDSSIDAAYLVEIQRGQEFKDVFLLVVIVADPRRDEHIARTFGQLLRNDFPSSPLPISLAVHPPGAPLPSLCTKGAQIFQRAHVWHAD